MTDSEIRGQKDIEPNHPHCSYEPWTTNYIKDELTFQLSSTKSSTIVQKTQDIPTINKYTNLPDSFFYRINLYKPSPEFLINSSDLTPSLQNELERLYKSSPKIFEQNLDNNPNNISTKSEKLLRSLFLISSPTSEAWRYCLIREIMKSLIG